ncbi:MAG: SPOR domain-containing protein [Spirochaetales bacterium]|nr:SPOR domain-containing protein [Spirochaetales bacterium]
MRFLFVCFLSLRLAQVLVAQDLPEALRDASVLELQGHFSQALSAYEKVLALEPRGGPAWILSKASFLALSLGQVQKAQDLAQTLTQTGDPEAEQLGLLVQMSLLRQAQRAPEALRKFRRWQAAHATVPILLSLDRELGLCLSAEAKNTFRQHFLKVQPTGGEFLLASGEAEMLPYPQIPPAQNRTQILQLGVFRNLENARQLEKKLSSKGWTPQLERTVQAGFRLYRVSIPSDQADQDLEKLKIQGFESFILSR